MGQDLESTTAIHYVAKFWMYQMNLMETAELEVEFPSKS